ncbi:hypothetical protein Ddc_19648 [Ditylenchus destructor]|nr:hypothetical protein Ddc_19648 [Ditylenchus destructor]
MSTTQPEPDPNIVKEVEINAELATTEALLRRCKPALDRFFTFDIKDWSDNSKSESSRPKALLHLLIALIMYGPPDESAFPDDGAEDFLLSAEKKFSRYPKDRRKHFMKLARRILKCAENGSKDRLEFSRILLGIRKESDGCITYQLVIKVRYYIQSPGNNGKREERFKYVDFDGRIYGSFEDFVGNNKLPKCSFCYIDEENVLKTEESVALKRKKVHIGLVAGDIVATGACVGAGVGTALVAAPVAVVACATTTVVASSYFIGRNIAQLYDKCKHGQKSNGENALLVAGTVFGVLGIVSAPIGALVNMKVISTSVVANVAKTPIGRVVLTILGKEGSLASSTATEVAFLGARGVVLVGSGIDFLVNFQRLINDVIEAIDSLFLDAPYASEEVKDILLKNLEKLANMMFTFHNTVMPVETMGHVVVIFKRRFPGLLARGNTQNLNSLDVLEKLYVIIREFDTGIDDSEHSDNERPLMDLFEKTELAQSIKSQIICLLWLLEWGSLDS